MCKDAWRSGVTPTRRLQPGERNCLRVWRAPERQRGHMQGSLYSRSRLNVFKAGNNSLYGGGALIYFYKDSVRTAEKSQSSDINQFIKTTQNRYCWQVCGGGEVVFDLWLCVNNLGTVCLWFCFSCNWQFVEIKELKDEKFGDIQVLYLPTSFGHCYFVFFLHIYSGPTFIHKLSCWFSTWWSGCSFDLMCH